MQKRKKNLEGKKLLILGGGSDMIGVTKLAQSMGCIVHVLDYYDTLRSPAKLAADAFSDLSIFDTDLVVAYIREHHIDGVLTGYTDSYLMQYLRICEAAGLPHFGSEQAFLIATDKMYFKKACIEYGVGVIPGTNAYNFETVQSFAEKNGYPLMLKPTDNSGSRGVVKCEEADSLQSCYDYAMSFSKSQNIIVEKYMDCDSVGIVYQLSRENIYLAALCDRDIYQAKADGSSIVSCTRYPSKYLKRYIEEADEAVRRMLAHSGFRDGMISPMAFVDDKGFYMCEMCYRPSGGHHFTLISDQNGIDGMKLLIEHAVTGETKSYDPQQENPFFHDYCGMIHIIGVPEKTVAVFRGVEEIRRYPGVLDVCQELSVGQKTGKDGTTAQTLLSVWLKAADREAFDQKAREIKALLQVFDSEGNSLVQR